MNRDNMKRLLDFYEAGAPHFDLRMDRSLIATTYLDATIPQLCGSAGCIAGSAFAMSLSDKPRAEAREQSIESYYSDDDLNGREATVYKWDRVEAEAMAFLGLEFLIDEEGDSYVIHPLFNPDEAPRNCTARQAAQAIRNVMDGKEPWVGVHDPEPEVA